MSRCVKLSLYQGLGSREVFVNPDLVRRVSTSQRTTVDDSPKSIVCFDNVDCITVVGSPDKVAASLWPRSGAS